MSGAAIDGDVLDRLEAILRDHRGPDNPITSSELADRLSVDDAEGNPVTREAIKELCKERGLPVAAGHAGYYLIETESQLEEYLDGLENRKQGIEARMWLVRKAWRESQGQSQMTLQEGSA